jgi:hypothetical protein
MESALIGGPPMPRPPMTKNWKKISEECVFALIFALLSTENQPVKGMGV